MTKPVLNSVAAYFGGNFPRNEFAHLGFTFLRVFKLFGFFPVKLRKIPRFEWDLWACCWTAVAAVVYGGGFWLALHDLHISDTWDSKHDASQIAYLTGWIQVFILFTLGIVAVFSSWLNVDRLRVLCGELYEIDRRLEVLMPCANDYHQSRVSFLWQFALSLVVPLFLSMVNCFIINPDPSFNMLTGCYWFICFAPIMLITFKELQFMTLMKVLRSKFALLNEKVTSYSQYREVRRDKPFKVMKVQSIQEIPLAAYEEPEMSIATLQQLFQTYTLIAECVDVVMKMFSWHILFVVTASFCIITIQSYNLFALLVHSLNLSFIQVVIVVGWILVQVFTIAFKIYTCSKTSKTMAATGPLILKVNIQTTMEPACLFYQLVQLFMLEIQERRQNFTAAGFFDMDYKLITSILTAVTTYLVIIIQFHLTSDHGH